MVKMVIEVEEEFAKFIIEMAARAKITTGELIMTMCAEFLSDAFKEFINEKPKEVS